MIVGDEVSCLFSHLGSCHVINTSHSTTPKGTAILGVRYLRFSTTCFKTEEASWVIGKMFSGA